MKPFDFVLVIISIIVGLAFTEFAIGVSYLIQNFSASTFYLPYFVLITAGFTVGLNYWASLYALRTITSWNTLKMGILFLTGLIFYITARVFIPDPENFDHDYEKFFHDNIARELILLILFVVSLLMETLILKKSRSLKSYVIMIGFMLLMLSGVLIESRSYREVLAYLLLMLQIFNLIVNKWVIEDKVG